MIGAEETAAPSACLAAAKKKPHTVHSNSRGKQLESATGTVSTKNMPNLWRLCNNYFKIMRAIATN